VLRLRLGRIAGRVGVGRVRSGSHQRSSRISRVCCGRLSNTCPAMRERLLSSCLRMSKSRSRATCVPTKKCYFLVESMRRDQGLDELNPTLCAALRRLLEMPVCNRKESFRTYSRLHAIGCACLSRRQGRKAPDARCCILPATAGRLQLGLLLRVSDLDHLRAEPRSHELLAANQVQLIQRPLGSARFTVIVGPPDSNSTRPPTR
jgi:hypothetical protein